MFAYALPRLGSDHIPIMLKGGEAVSRLGPTPFEFQSMWLLHPGFVDMVKSWWEDLDAHDLLGQIFRLKLKGIRDRLRTWNKEVFGDIETRKKTCREHILRWDSLEEGEGLEDVERLAWKDAQREFEMIIEMEEIMWR